MKQLIVLREAKAELGKSRKWYDKQQTGLGLELVDEVLAALSRIERDPETGPRYLNSQFRFYRVRRFPFVIYYLSTPDIICVMAITHERRRPNYWRNRTPKTEN